MPLTDTACRNAKPKPKVQKLSDSEGLYLFVSPEGSKLWRVDYRFAGKRKTLSLGPYPLVTLLDARSKRDEAKRGMLNGVDPALARKKAKAQLSAANENSFESVAREWLMNQREAWTDKYANLVETRLEADVFVSLGQRPIADIEAMDVLEVLRKVETRGALDIAKRLRQTCGQIFRYAIVTGRAKRDPTADLKGALKSSGRPKHHRAMPREELPAFLRALEAYDGYIQTKLALKLMVLTFVRTGELRAARWSEIEKLDGREPLWRIPAERMKMKTEHLVPLSRQAVAALKELQAQSASDYIFPSPGAEKVMSNNTMLFALYRMGYHRRATVHGFRGLASTCLNEAGFQSDWIERQLAHDERNSVRRAYNAAQYLSDRKKMMSWWADYLDRVRLTVNTSLEEV